MSAPREGRINHCNMLRNSITTAPASTKCSNKMLHTRNEKHAKRSSSPEAHLERIQNNLYNSSKAAHPTGFVSRSLLGRRRGVQFVALGYDLVRWGVRLCIRILQKCTHDGEVAPELAVGMTVLTRRCPGRSVRNKCLPLRAAERLSNCTPPPVPTKNKSSTSNRFRAPHKPLHALESTSFERYFRTFVSSVASPSSVYRLFPLLLMASSSLLLCWSDGVSPELILSKSASVRS